MATQSACMCYTCLLSTAAKLVKCTGECRGAKMAQARYKRKVAKLRRMGKDPYRLDDWRNTSFVCNCNDE